MKVTSKNHDGIIVIDVLPEKGDNEAACLWMRVYLDPEHGQMLSDSDIGDYAHRWQETGKQFLKLMGGVGSTYLLEKCCHDRMEYDPEHIIESIHDYFCDAEYDDPSEEKKQKDFLEEVSQCCNIFDIQRVFDDTDFDYGDAWECVQKTYTPWQKRWASYFTKYVSPEIKKWIPEIKRTAEKSR